MNRIRRTPRFRRLAALLAGLTAGLLGLAAALPAFAQAAVIPAGAEGGGGVAPAVTRVTVAGGMPGWEIALIAIGAAVVAAACAVLAYRALAGRRQPAPTTA